MRTFLLTLVVLAFTTAGASAQGWAEKLFPDGLVHDFGTVPRGTQLLYKFKVKNIYAVPITITNVQSSCGCITATATKRIIESTKTGEIEIRMDARRFTGLKSVGVRVTVGPEFISSAELTIKANSRTDVVFNPGQVSFGSVTRGQTPTQSVKVEYAGNLDWQVSEVVAKDVPYRADIKEIYRKPGIPRQVGYTLSVTLKDDAPVGTLTHFVYLKTNDPATPLVPVLIEANVQSALTVLPAVLSLGAVKTDSTLTRRVVVRGNRSFRVKDVEGTGDGIELGATLAATDAEVQFVTFKCKFDKPGPFKRELKIKTSIQDAAIVVTIEGTAAK